MKVVIIDDEVNSRAVIKKQLEKHCPEVEIVDMADGVKEGVRVIKKTLPDVVFLDIKMNDGSGFDVLNAFKTIDFKIIFITAFDQYAIKAFKYSALHYLLKPIDPSELKEAVERAKENLQDYEEATENFKSTYNGDFQNITLNTEHKYHNIPLDEIVYVEADSNYSRFYLNNDKQILVTKTLKEFEDFLPGEQFMRIHKSYILNMNYFQTFQPSTCFIKLKNGQMLKVSRRNKTTFIRKMKELANT